MEVRKHYKVKSIRQKIVLYVGVILIMTCLFNYMVGKGVYKHLFKRHDSEMMKTLAYSTIHEIELIFEQMRLTLDEMHMMAMKCNKRLDLKLLEAVRVDRNIVLDEVVVIGQDGTGVSSTGKEVDISNTAIYKNIFIEQKIRYELMNWEGESYIVFLKPMTDEKQNITQFLLGMCRAEKFSEQIKSLSNGSDFFIIDENGNFIIDEINFEGDTYLANHITQKNLLTEVYDQEALVQELHIEERQFDFKGKILYEQLVGSNWTIGVIYKQDNSQLMIFDYAMLSAMALSIGLGILGVYLLGDSLAKRMRYIAAHIEEIAINERVEPLPEELLEGDDELGIIAKSMNKVEKLVAEMLIEVKHSTDYVNEMISDLKQKQEQCKDTDE